MRVTRTALLVSVGLSLSVGVPLEAALRPTRDDFRVDNIPVDGDPRVATWWPMRMVRRVTHDQLELPETVLAARDRYALLNRLTVTNHNVLAKGRLCGSRHGARRPSTRLG